MSEQEKPTKPAASLRLDPRRRGYIVDGGLREGFADDAGLLLSQRRLIARWAERFTPDALSAEQRKLLAAAPAPAVSEEQRELLENQSELRSPYLSVLFDSLSPEQQHLVQDPATAGEKVGAYPLTVGQLSALTGASHRQVRSWADEGLLPSYREGADRRFYSAAAIRAFALVRAPNYSKALAAAAARGEVGQHFQLLAATLGRAAAKMPADLRERLTALAEDLSSSSRLMSDVGNAEQLHALWLGVDPATPLPAEPAEKPSKEKRLFKHSVKGTYLPRGLDVHEADEILYAKYGGTELPDDHVFVFTAPRSKGGWANQVVGRNLKISVHETKAEAEARGRELARECHGKHVVYLMDGSISRSHSYD